MAHELQDDESIDLLKSELNKLKEPFREKIKYPPGCTIELAGKQVKYVHKKSLTYVFPVPKKFTNPSGGMQGGFISACFDDVFGPLSFVVFKNPTASLDLHTNYIRPIYAGDELTITVNVLSRGFNTIHMAGEGLNKKGKLIATCNTNMVVLKQ